MYFLVSCKSSGTFGNIREELHCFLMEFRAGGQNPNCSIAFVAFWPGTTYVNVNVIYHGNFAAFLLFCMAVKRAGPEPAERKREDQQPTIGCTQAKLRTTYKSCFFLKTCNHSHVCEYTHALQFCFKRGTVEEVHLETVK